LTPITDEVGAKAPAVSPDGQWLYYIVDQTTIGSGRLWLKRVRLDGTGREMLCAVEGRLDAAGHRFSRGYPISTISSDGRRMVYSGFLGDGSPETATWGFLTFFLDRGAFHLHVTGPDWHNLHPQYSRSQDPVRSHDVLIQHNHGSVYDARCESCGRLDALGADIHVIRDDGAGLRDMPWGRDGVEFCQGHQCWIGRSERAITSTYRSDGDEQQIIEGREAPESEHVGIRIPGAWRNDLSRVFPTPHFYHFATDIAGDRFITDHRAPDGLAVYVAEFPDQPDGAFRNIRRVAGTRGGRDKTAHTHPFLSPDGRFGFFNSDESGRLQAYMVRGF
jgi:hypothetical protein